MEDLIKNLQSSIADNEEEAKAETKNSVKDSEHQNEAKEQTVKDRDDESTSPVPEENGASELAENGHSNGHSNGVSNGKLVEPSSSGQNDKASEKLAHPGVNGQTLSLESMKNSSTEIAMKMEMDLPAQDGTKVPKKRGRKVAKGSDEEPSDADVKIKAPVKRNRANSSIATVVLDSDDETDPVATPSKRTTRSQHFAAVLLDSDDENDPVVPPSKRTTRSQQTAAA
jgi:hypothetical protein